MDIYTKKSFRNANARDTQHILQLCKHYPRNLSYLGGHLRKSFAMPSFSTLINFNSGRLTLLTKRK